MGVLGDMEDPSTVILQIPEVSEVVAYTLVVVVEITTPNVLALVIRALPSLLYNDPERTMNDDQQSLLPLSIRFVLVTRVPDVGHAFESFTSR